MKVYQWSVLAVMLMAMSLNAADAVSRHSGEGSIGPNGVRQRVAIKINKTATGKDAAAIQLDLGDHKYPSTKPEAWINPTPTVESGIKYRPQIILTLGTTVVLKAVSDSKGKLSGDFKGKLINKGAGLKIDVKKGSLGTLLSELSGKGEHLTLFVKIQDDHAPAVTPESRHASALFELLMEVDVQENAKTLTAKG
jgi:hypothetical protein